MSAALCGMKRSTLLRLASLAVLLAASSALAEEQIKIGGNYGNEAGCKYLKDGVYGDDNVLALTPKEVQTAVTLCSFVTATTLEGGTIVASVICGHEGEETQTLGLMRFTKVYEQDKWGIFDANGDTWGEVSPCR